MPGLSRSVEVETTATPGMIRLRSSNRLTGSSSPAVAVTGGAEAWLGSPSPQNESCNQGAPWPPDRLTTVTKSAMGVTQRKVVTLSSLCLALGFILSGGALLWWSGTTDLRQDPQLSAFLSQTGGLLLASGLLTIGWDLVGRRAFADEVLAKARVSADVDRSGIVRVTDQYLEEVEWDELFRDVQRLDIVVAYASTWRNTHRGRLERVAKRKGTRLRAFLPNPRDVDTMRVLAERFNMSVEQATAKVEEAVADFASLAKPEGGDVEVWLRSGDLVFSCYRFDSRAVLTLYSHSRERRTQVPTFVVSEGELFRFVYDELRAIAGQSSRASTEGAVGHEAITPSPEG